MSNAIFPTFVGLSWPVKRTPIFNTKVQKAVSGRETRIAFMTYPLYKIELSFDYLSLTDWATLGGFFKSRKGKWDSFLFDDLNDNLVTNQPIGSGNGTATQFQLVRSLGGFTEPVQNPKIGLGQPTLTIYINGVAQAPLTNYSLNVFTGVITFTSPPANGDSISWSGGYRWRVRFDQDEAEFGENISKFFDLKKLVLYGATGNKV